MIKKIYILEIGMSLFIICLVNACSLYSSQKFEETNISSPIYKEHNDEYLAECIENLAGKGIKLDI